MKNFFKIFGIIAILAVIGFSMASCNNEPDQVVPKITTETLPNGVVGTAYSQTLTAEGEKPITWSIDSGTLPAGLTLAERTGEISGTPTTSGSYTFTVKAANTKGNDTKKLTITITNGSTGNGGNGNGTGSGGSGTSRTNAILVTVGNSSSHTINSSGEHWFKFVGTGDPIIFETRGNVVDTYIEVYAGDNSNTYSWNDGADDDNSGGGSNALVSKGTTSGTTYYIKITSRSGTSGNYTFVVSSPTSNIRTNPITVMVGNSSSHIIADGTHWFIFTGTGDRVFFETEGDVVKTNMNIYLGDSTSSSYSKNQSNKGINFITVSGTTYYIRITGNSGTYTFNVRNGTGDGSSRYNAKEITKGYSSSHTISYSGEIWFMYQGTGEPVTFKTTGNVVDTYIEVYAGDNSSTYSWNDGADDDNSGEGSNALVNKGTTSGTTYTVKITPRSGTSGSFTFVVE